MEHSSEEHYLGILDCRDAINYANGLDRPHYSVPAIPLEILDFIQGGKHGISIFQHGRIVAEWMQD